MEPSDVRKQANCYGNALSEHENRFGKESEKVKAWRLALTEVGNIKGEHCRKDM